LPQRGWTIEVSFCSLLHSEISWLVVWIVVTTLRARVVEFFEKHDEDGALTHYHNLTEGRAHRAGFWIFTVVFPAMFALFWLTLILIAYGFIRIG
jgi:hypothetical protein